MGSLVLSKEEKELIFSLAEQLTGSCQQGKYRRNVLVANVVRRMKATDQLSLDAYLDFANKNSQEFSELVSSVTIHTTHWFRESNHYRRLEDLLTKEGFNLTDEKFTLLSAASSTGEEAFSFALVLEHIRRTFPGFDYAIEGRDIDPISVAKANRGIYPTNDDVRRIPEKFKKYILRGSGKTEGLIAFDPEIRKRVKFKVKSLEEEVDPNSPTFDWIVCRNVLIYFKPEVVDTILVDLLKQLKPTGMLVLGSSESIEPKKFELVSVGASSYVHKNIPEYARGRKRRILCIDDSPTMRAKLTRMLAKDYKVVAVESADDATDYLKINKVDLITLDLQMPGKDGKTWLVEQRNAGLATPVIIISGAAHLEIKDALDIVGDGAQDCIEKAELSEDPNDLVPRLNSLMEGHVNKMALVQKRKEGRRLIVKPNMPDLLLIGAGTGGPDNLSQLFKNMPSIVPPILVVLQASANISKALADKLVKLSGLKTEVPRDDLVLKPGHIYMARGDYHIGVKQRRKELVLQVSNSSPINRQRPSIDFLFKSAQMVDAKIFAVLLSGMGKGGASSLADLKKKGATTFVQDEASSTVYEMGKEAIRLGGASFVGDPYEIRREMDRAFLKVSKVA